jgi:hypothetical protein
MRMRIVLPKVWESKTFGGVSWDARFLLVGLWSFCDDEGRGLDATALIAATLFPYDLQNDPTETYRRTAAALDELAAAGLIWRYQVHDENYLQIISWDLWQQPRRPTPSRFPIGNCHCPECGALLIDKGVTRADARFCSSTCRQRARRRDGTKDGTNDSEPNLSRHFPDETAGQDDFDEKIRTIPEDSPTNYGYELRTTNYELRSRDSGRATRLPNDWQPSPRVVAQMRDKYPTVNQNDDLIENFRDYWHAKAGKDAQKCDWDATYRNRIRWLSEHQPNTNGYKPSTADQRVAQGQELKKRFREQRELE